MDSITNTPDKKTGFTLKLDYRLIILVLLAAIVAMLIIWKPWSPAPNNNDRTITVTGESTLKETPDEYLFYPSYTFKNTDKAAALAQVSDKSTEITKKLKELGVADKDIKNDSSGFNYNYYYDRDDNTTTYTLQLNITAHTQEMAQKVQDYLITTTPEGQVTPQAQFSEAKRKTLESQGRDTATKDARAKADQSAKNLGFKVGGVKSVQDSGNGYGPYYPMASGLSTGIADDSAKSSISVQPGQNDLTYSVTVVYYVK